MVEREIFVEDREGVERERIELARQYYTLVDSGDIDNMLQLFSVDVTYNRCGEDVNGLEEMTVFYKEKRTLQGSHSIESMIVEGDTVVVRGVFNGKNDQEDRKCLQFADFFIFNEENKVTERRTYLAEGYNQTI